MSENVDTVTTVEPEPKGGWIVYEDENGDRVRVSLQQYRDEGRG